MAINQIFIKQPPLIIIETLLTYIGITLKNEQYFNYRIIEQNNERIIDILEKQFKQYYLLCKSRIYLTDITPKKIVTIIRHCVKLYGYKIVSKEICRNSNKTLEFKIIQMNKKPKNSLDFN